MVSDKIIPTIEASRDYIVTDTAFTKCDMCKRFFGKAFDLTPVKKTHNFDNIVLCMGCIDKCQLKFNIDIKELILEGSVEKWQKTKI